MDHDGALSSPCAIRTSENQVVRPGEQDLYIKLTYSVIREDVMEASHSKDAADKLKKPPKWHMSTPPRISRIRPCPDFSDRPRTSPQTPTLRS